MNKLTSDLISVIMDIIVASSFIGNEWPVALLSDKECKDELRDLLLNRLYFLDLQE